MAFYDLASAVMLASLPRYSVGYRSVTKGKGIRLHSHCECVVRAHCRRIYGIGGGVAIFANYHPIRQCGKHFSWIMTLTANIYPKK